MIESTADLLHCPLSLLPVKIRAELLPNPKLPDSCGIPVVEIVAQAELSTCKHRHSYSVNIDYLLWQASGSLQESNAKTSDMHGWCTCAWSSQLFSTETVAVPYRLPHQLHYTGTLLWHGMASNLSSASYLQSSWERTRPRNPLSHPTPNRTICHRPSRQHSASTRMPPKTKGKNVVD